MAKRWDRLAGETGRRVDTSRLGRAIKLGRLATRFTGSVISAQVKRRLGQGEEEAFANAAAANARRIVEVMGEMKGAAMKVGQLLSSDPDMLTPEFANQLAKLQKSAPPMTFIQVSQVIEAALDRPLPDLFRFFDPEPIGAASIGQVHRAVLSDGREVAVKVQYPGIAGSLDADLRNLGSLLKVGRVFLSKDRADAFIAEAREAILQETDYLSEAANLARFHEAFSRWPDVRVPQPHLELCRPNVLVMEFIEGRKLDEAAAALDTRARRDKVVARFVEVFVYMFHEMNCLHADPHPGNFLLTEDDVLVFLDFGCVRSFRRAATDEMLEMLVAVWDDDMERVCTMLRALDFGRPDKPLPSHASLRTYFHLLLRPFLNDGPFNFSTWRVHADLRSFLFKNRDFWTLAPPAELLLYFRVLTGVKGMLTRIDGEVNVRAMAEATAREHGIS